MADILRINLWSGPRNVSTALMYAFAQRPDTRVVDEPLYAHYLRVADPGHPGAAEVMASMEADAAQVIQKVILGPCDRPILFVKQMAHHLVELDWAFMAKTVNVLLVRDPEEMLPSLVQNLPQATLRDTGLAKQTELLDFLRGLGQNPPVLEARELLRNPKAVLGELCQKIGIFFDEGMLSWSAGPRPEDGVWAQYWYHNVHRSTGFQPYRPKSDPFPPNLRSLLAECRPHYAQLYAQAIKAP